MNELLTKEIQRKRFNWAALLVVIVLIAGVTFFYLQQKPEEKVFNDSTYAITFGSINIEKHEFYSEEQRFTEIKLKTEKASNIVIYALIPSELAVNERQLKITGDAATKTLNENPLILYFETKFKKNELNAKLDFTRKNNKCILLFPFAKKMLDSMSETEKAGLLEEIKGYSELELDCIEANDLEVKLAEGIYNILKKPFELEFKEEKNNKILFAETNKWYEDLEKFLEESLAKEKTREELKKGKEGTITETKNEIKRTKITIIQPVHPAELRASYPLPKQIELYVSNDIPVDEIQIPLVLDVPVYESGTTNERTNIEKPKVKLSENITKYVTVKIEGESQPYLMTVTAEFPYEKAQSLQGTMTLDYSKTELLLKREITIKIINDEILQALSDVPEYWQNQEQTKNYLIGQLYEERAIEEKDTFYKNFDESIEALNEFLQANKEKEITGIVSDRMAIYTTNCESIQVPDLKGYNQKEKIYEYYQKNCESLKAYNNAIKDYEKTLESYKKALTTTNKDPEANFTVEEKIQLLLKTAAIYEEVLDLSKTRIEQLKIYSSLKSEDVLKLQEKLEYLQQTEIPYGMETQSPTMNVTTAELTKAKEDFEFLEGRIDFYLQRHASIYSNTRNYFNELAKDKDLKEKAEKIKKIFEKKEKIEKKLEDLSLIEGNPYKLKEQEEILLLQEELNNDKLSLGFNEMKITPEERKARLLELIKMSAITYLKADSEELNEILTKLDKETASLTSFWNITSTYWLTKWALPEGKGGHKEALEEIERMIYAVANPMKTKIDLAIAQLENKKDASIEDVYNNLIKAKAFNESNAPVPLKKWVEIEKAVKETGQLPKEEELALKFYEAADYYLREETRLIAVKKYSELINNFFTTSNPQTKKIIGEAQNKLLFEADKYKNMTEGFIWKLETTINELLDLKWWLAFEVGGAVVTPIVKATKTGQTIIKMAKTEIKLPRVLTTTKGKMSDKTALLITRLLRKLTIIKDLEAKSIGVLRKKIVANIEEKYPRLSKVLFKKITADPKEMLTNFMYKKITGVSPLEAREIAITNLAKGSENVTIIETTPEYFIGKVEEVIKVTIRGKEMQLFKAIDKSGTTYYGLTGKEGSSVILKVSNKAEYQEIGELYSETEKMLAIMKALEEKRFTEFLTDKYLSEKLIAEIEAKEALLKAALKEKTKGKISEKMLEETYLKKTEIKNVNDIFSELRTANPKTIETRGGHIKTRPEETKQTKEIINTACSERSVQTLKLKEAYNKNTIYFAEMPLWPPTCKGSQPSPPTKEKVVDLTSKLAQEKIVFPPKEGQFSVDFSLLQIQEKLIKEVTIEPSDFHRISKEFAERKLNLKIGLPEGTNEVKIIVSKYSPVTGVTLGKETRFFSSNIKFILEGNENVKIIPYSELKNIPDLPPYTPKGKIAVLVKEEEFISGKKKSVYIIVPDEFNFELIIEKVAKQKPDLPLRAFILNTPKTDLGTIKTSARNAINVFKTMFKKEDGMLTETQIKRLLFKSFEGTEPFNVAVVSTKGIKELNTKYGIDKVDNILQELSSILNKKGVKVGQIYADNIVLLYPKGNAKELAKIIEEAEQELATKIKGILQGEDISQEDLTLFAGIIEVNPQQVVDTWKINEVINNAKYAQMIAQISSNIKLRNISKEPFFGKLQQLIKERIRESNKIVYYDDVSSIIKQIFENEELKKLGFNKEIISLRLSPTTPNVNKFIADLEDFVKNFKGTTQDFIDELKGKMFWLLKEEYALYQKGLSGRQIAMLVGDDIMDYFLTLFQRQRHTVFLGDLAKVAEINKALGQENTDKFVAEVIEKLQTQLFNEREKYGLGFIVRKNRGSDELMIIFEKELSEKEQQKLAKTLHEEVRKVYFEIASAPESAEKALGLYNEVGLRLASYTATPGESIANMRAALSQSLKEAEVGRVNIHEGLIGPITERPSSKLSDIDLETGFVTKFLEEHYAKHYKLKEEALKVLYSSN